MANLNKTDLVKDFIRNNPGATIRETVKQCGVSRALVSLVRRELASQSGDLPRSRSKDPSIGNEGAFEEALSKVLEGRGVKLSPAQQAQLYSELAVHPKAHPNTRISSLNGLRALEATASQTNQIGPGPPLTDEDVVLRLSLLMSAVGIPLSQRAWDAAFATKSEDFDVLAEADQAVYQS